MGTLATVPELPEVESYRRLALSVVGRSILSVAAQDGWYLKNGTTEGALQRICVGCRLAGVRRIGKLLLFEFRDRQGTVETGVDPDVDPGVDPVVGIRFGMTGSLRLNGHSNVGQLLYTSRRNDPAWDRVIIRFAGGDALAVHDPRRLGGVIVDPDVSHLGPDALSISLADMVAAVASSTAPLKARLLDQSKVAGIGNLIADELLWQTGLSPVRSAGSLSANEVHRLHGQLSRTLAELIGRGGSHLGDLMAERHTGGVCPKDGAELARTIVGGRTSWWCPVHQV
jgi:formamidopyrimidine-DNA glycosylase